MPAVGFQNERTSRPPKAADRCWLVCFTSPSVLLMPLIHEMVKGAGVQRYRENDVNSLNNRAISDEYAPSDGYQHSWCHTPPAAPPSTPPPARPLAAIFICLLYRIELGGKYKYVVVVVRDQELKLEVKACTHEAEAK